LNFQLSHILECSEQYSKTQHTDCWQRLLSTDRPTRL